MFFLPSYTGFLSPKSCGLKCCTMYSTTSLQVATQNTEKRDKYRDERVCAVPIKMHQLIGISKISGRRKPLLGRNIDRAGCSWAVQYFHGQKIYEKGPQKKGRLWSGRCLFNAWLPWPSFNRGGGLTFHRKGKVKEPDLLGVLWTSVSNP